VPGIAGEEKTYGMIGCGHAHIDEHAVQQDFRDATLAQLRGEFVDPQPEQRGRYRIL
jgi:hypothetical protein